jgi:hypothetical protein
VKPTTAPCLAALLSLLVAAPSWAAEAGADQGDSVLYIAAAPFVLGGLGLVLYFARSIWLLSRPSKPPQAH